MKIFRLLILLLVVLSACKSSKETSSGKGQLNNLQKAEVTNLFFNASKEKILGNFESAAQLYSEVIRRDGRNAAAMYELANIYSEQKKFGDALFFAKGAYTIDSKNVWYALTYADILQKNRKNNDAAEVLEKLVHDNPENPEYYYEWASSLIQADRPMDAVKAYDKLEAKFGINREVIMQKSRIYQRLNKTDKAIEELQKLIASDPKDVQAYGMLSEVYQSIGQKEKALETYNTILKIDPDNPYVHLSLADFYRANGEKDKSLEELKKAFVNKNLDSETKIGILGAYFSLLELHPELKEQSNELCRLLVETHPNEPKAHAVYGDFLEQDKKVSEARDEYAKARQLGSKDFVVYSRLMFLDAQLLRWDSVLTISNEAKELFPDQAIVYFFNGMAYQQKKNYEAAVSSLNVGSKLIVDNKPLETQFYIGLGDAYNELKNYEKSDENYEKALAISPKDPNVLNNYSYYLSLRGEKLDKAEEMSRLSNELEPTQASYQDTYAWIMYRQGKYSEAKIWMEKAMSNSKEQSATLLEHYGDILFKIGDTTKALEYWNKAKQAGEGASEFLDRKILEKKIFE